MNTASKYDIVIVGAGPAGCASAIILGKAGLSVALVDGNKQLDIKEGESLPGATARLLSRLGISSIKDLLNENEYLACTGNASKWGGDDWQYQDALLNPEGGGWHIDRVAFDAALKKLAIAHVTDYIEEYVSKIETEEEYCIKFRDSSLKSVQANWLIDASGRKAIVSKQITDSKTIKKGYQLAAIYWLEASINDNDYASRIKATPEGWWYTALLPNRTRVVSFMGLPHSIKQLMADKYLFIKQLNEAAIIPYEILANKILSSKATQAGMSVRAHFTVDNLLFVGDAAIASDPLSSQGIFFALYSGIKAAETIIKSHNEKDKKETHLNLYSQSIERVYNETQRSRQYHYNNEYRYRHLPYWKMQLS